MIDTHQGGAHMAGRWVVWFLEDGLSKYMYRKHKKDVEDVVRKDTWRGMLRLYVDFRLWEEGRKHEDFFTNVDGGWYGEAKPDWVHFWEISGKSMFLHKVNGVECLRFIPHGEDVMIDIPIHAIVSSGSSGFPKVAYSVDQYLIGYVGWVDAIQASIDENPEGLNALEPQLLVENFSNDVYAAIQDMVQGLRLRRVEKDRSGWLDQLNQLIMLMMGEMKEKIPSRCKPPYFHPVELGVPPSILLRSHPLIETYLMLRKKFPNMVMGRGFIEIKKEKKKAN